MAWWCSAPLVVVLGHERRGAVQAAVNVVETDATYPGSIGQMIEPQNMGRLKIVGACHDLDDGTVEFYE